MSILNVFESPVSDNSIESLELHSYKPYVTSFNKNDEIRIPINQQDLYVLPSASTLYLEGVVKIYNSETKQYVNTINYINNSILFLFQEIRYELNGIEIDKIKNAGVTTTIKSYLSMTENESRPAKAWGWSINGNSIINKDGSFSVSIPLNKVLGFAEDYKKIVMNCKHELVLLRSNTNLNALILGENEVVEDIIIHKIIWRVPHVKVSDREKVCLLKNLEKDRAITLAFRNWDLYEYPLLPQTRKHTWSIKTSSHIEKPRYVILGLQTARKQNVKSSMSEFDHCNLTDVKVFLNSAYYPYENLNNSFSDHKVSLIYEQYCKFQQSYYGSRPEPLLTLKEFKDIAPLFVIDCCRQQESLKGSVDVRLEIEADQDIPDQTSAYCLILNDCIFEYKPLSSIVRKIS